MFPRVRARIVHLIVHRVANLRLCLVQAMRQLTAETLSLEPLTTDLPIPRLQPGAGARQEGSLGSVSSICGNAFSSVTSASRSRGNSVEWVYVMQNGIKRCPCSVRQTFNRSASFGSINQRRGRRRVMAVVPIPRIDHAVSADAEKGRLERGLHQRNVSTSIRSDSP